MGCLGVHLAITPAQAQRLLAARTPEQRQAIIYDELEAEWVATPDYPWAYQTDKSWDAMHRCLTDGTLECANGALSRFVLGGRELAVPDLLAHLVDPGEALAAVHAAASIDEAWLRERYFRLSSDDAGYTIDEDDFAYTWEYFQPLPAFYRRAADAGRWILFTATQ